MFPTGETFWEVGGTGIAIILFSKNEDHTGTGGIVSLGELGLSFFQLRRARKANNESQSFIRNGRIGRLYKERVSK